VAITFLTTVAVAFSLFVLIPFLLYLYAYAVTYAVTMSVIHAKARNDREIARHKRSSAVK